VEVIAVLQTVRLKGRLAPASFAAVSGLDAQQAALVLSRCISAGFVSQPANDGPVRITLPGQDELARLLALERAQLNEAALALAYDEFEPHNRALKQIVSDWQLRDAAVPNDHSDAGYDAAVLARLVALNGDSRSMLLAVVSEVPRLAHYPRRLDSALASIAAGEPAYVARPTVDSYHQVWFELHQELLDCLALSRAEETAAGRA
jgi:hypothetical protein